MFCVTNGVTLHPIKDDVFDRFAQFRFDIVIDRQVTGIDNAHIHPGLNRVIEEDRVDGTAHRLIATKGKADIRHTARNADIGQAAFDFGDCLYKIDSVIIMLVYAGRYREDIRVEDDVFGRKAHNLGQ